MSKKVKTIIEETKYNDYGSPWDSFEYKLEEALNEGWCLVSVNVLERDHKVTAIAHLTMEK